MAAVLAISGACCLLSPVLFNSSPSVFLGFLLLRGITVVGDSPQFSALNAENAPREFVGSAFTIVNSIGFLITIFSIQLASWLLTLISPQYIFLLLVPEPITGLWMLRPLRAGKQAA